MKIETQSNIPNNESGFVYVLFFLLLPIFLLLIGLVIDSSNLYSASLKANAAAEAGLTAAILSRINEKDPSIIATFGSLTDPPESINQAETTYLKTRTIDAANNNLIASGVLPKNSNVIKTNRSYEIESIIPDTSTNKLSVAVRIKVPTLFMHYTREFKNLGSRSASLAVNGKASTIIKGGNYVFVIDLSDSQACPAGVPLKAGGGQDIYCRCNTPNKVILNAPGGPRPETCQEEANRVPAPLNGQIRAQLTRDALIKGIQRLDRKRDRVAVIGFNSVAFPIINFREKEIEASTGISKAKNGFDLDFVVNRLKQIKSIAQAKAEFSTKPHKIGSGNDMVPVIVPEGNTNLSDAFITAYQEIKLSGLTKAEREKFNVIYYSDGAATAMRGNFNGITPPSYNSFNKRIRSPRTFASVTVNPQDNLNSYPQTLQGGGSPWSNDLINYQVVLSNGAGSFQYSMGPLVDASLYKRWYLDNLLNVTNVDQLGGAVVYVPRAGDQNRIATNNRINFASRLLPDCHCFSATAGAVSCNDLNPFYNNIGNWNSNKGYIYNQKIFDLDPAVRQLGFGSCFTATSGRIELQFPTSASASNSLGGQITLTNLNSSSKDFRYLYYMAAVEAAELLRSNGGRIHAIGYGAEAGNLSDVVQNLGDVAGLKAGMMANLASAFDDINAMFPLIRDPNTGEPIPDPDFNRVPQFDSNLYDNYQSLKDRKGKGTPAGAFYKSPDAQQFESLLNLLITQIRMSTAEVN